MVPPSHLLRTHDIVMFTGFPVSVRCKGVLLLKHMSLVGPGSCAMPWALSGAKGLL